MSYQIDYCAEYDAADIRITDRQSRRTTGMADYVAIDFDSDGDLCNIEVHTGADALYGLNGPDAQERAAELVTWVREQLASRAR